MVEDKRMHFSVSDEDQSPGTAGDPKLVSGATFTPGRTGKDVVVGAVNAGAHTVVETGKVILETGRGAGDLGKLAIRVTGDAMLTTGKVATDAVLSTGRVATGAIVVTS